MRIIANYSIEDEPIARGGMGQIFRGYDSLGKSCQNLPPIGLFVRVLRRRSNFF